VVFSHGRCISCSDAQKNRPKPVESRN
jgi:hypothetical protein